MGFAPASAGTSSSGEWSLGSSSAGRKVGGGGHSNLHRHSALSSLRSQGGGGCGGGGRSVFGTANASVTSRSRTVLVPSSSASQANNVPILRPMTGLARRNTTTATTASRSSSTTATLLKGSHIVESAGYYQSILQSKISDIVQEIERLQYETEMANGQSKPRMALQTKHDDLMSAVQTLEGNLADYNIAREHFRLGSSPGDIQNSTLRILANNEAKEKEIDGVFYKRNKVEDDIAVVETELKRRHALVEEANMGGVHGDNIDVVDEYRSLVNQIEAVTVETEQQEDETVVLRHKLQAMMMNDSSDEKNLAEGMKKQLTEVEEDIGLALMKDNEARDHLLRKIDSVQLSTTELEEESLQLEEEITTLREEHKRLLSEKIQGGTVKACNRLLQKDANLKQNLEEHLPNLKAKLENERSQVEMNIESLRNDIREKERMLEMELPSNEEMELMKDEMAFTEKNLDVNQETMTLLQKQKKKRMDEVCALCLKCCDDNSSVLSPHFLDRFFLSWIISIHSMTK